MDKRLRVFEAFAGVGSQRMALRNLNIDYEVVGISEIDIDAIISYAAICNVDLNKDIKMIDKIIHKLKNMNIGFDFKKKKSKLDRLSKLKIKQLANANEGIKNFGDISKINPNELPDMDLFTYSFPCQDLSVAGKQAGLVVGTRSGLLYECEKVIEVKRPKYLLLENVKNLVGKKFKCDFDKWLEYLERLGYKNYWKVLNAKEYGIPQNRERVFVVSILNENQGYNFPKSIQLEKTIKDILENKVDEKYYINKTFKITDEYDIKNKGCQDIIVKARLTDFSYKQVNQILDYEGICITLDTMQGGYREPKILIPQVTKQGCIEIENNFRVRKLTPLECWRLMGFKDEDFYKAKNVGISDSQLYKQAGNSIVVKVLEGIFRSLFLYKKSESCKMVEETRKEDNNIQIKWVI